MSILKVHVILNPSSGTEPVDRTEQIREAFSNYPDVSYEVHELRRARDIGRETRKALQSGADIIAAGGGDGTVSSVAHLLVGGRAALGILPLGTLNHLARDLGVPEDLHSAVDVICVGRTIAIDVGEVNDRYFVNNVSLGAYPKVVRLRSKWRPTIGKWPAMGLAIVAALVRVPRLRLQVEWDGNVIRRFFPLLFVGNNPYETRLRDLGRRLALSKGVLWLMAPKEARGWKRIRAIAYALAGRISDVNEIDVAEVKTLVVKASHRSITIGLDGETLKEESPLVFRSHPGALHVRIPHAPT